MKLFKFQSSLVLAAEDAKQASELLFNIYKGSLILRPLEITSENDLPFGKDAKSQPYNSQSLYEDGELDDMYSIEEYLNGKVAAIQAMTKIIEK